MSTWAGRDFATEIGQGHRLEVLRLGVGNVRARRFDRLGQQFLLGGPSPVNGQLADPGPLGDLLDAGAFHSPLHEELECCFQDRSIGAGITRPTAAPPDWRVRLRRHREFPCRSALSSHCASPALPERPRQARWASGRTSITSSVFGRVGTRVTTFDPNAFSTSAEALAESPHTSTAQCPPSSACSVVLVPSMRLHAMSGTRSPGRGLRAKCELEPKGPRR